MNRNEQLTDTETGIVVEESGGEILVECEPHRLCVGCAARDSCMMSGDTKKRHVWMENTVDALPGDRVAFIVEAKGVIYASLILYFLPVLFLFAGLYLGYTFYSFTGLEREGASALGGVFMISVSFLLVRVISGISSRKAMFRPRAVEKLESCR